MLEPRLLNRTHPTDVSANGNITNNSQPAKLSISGNNRTPPNYMFGNKFSNEKSFFRALYLVLISSNLLAQGTGILNKYPNELKGYKLFHVAIWNALEPLESTSADVDRILGKPNPVYRGKDDKWAVLVHFVGEKSECNGNYWPSELTGKLSDITLRPRIRISFLAVKFPKAFKKGEWYSSHATVQVDGYSDENGLTYYIYRDDSPDGTIKKGDLQAIVYSYSRKKLAEKAGCQ